MKKIWYLSNKLLWVTANAQSSSEKTVIAARITCGSDPREQPESLQG
uniref:Uncharacterized protein n=1 Tax=Arundo donax TaxID=35708 RepID=A0A0A9A7Y4_ARUDO